MAGKVAKWGEEPCSHKDIDIPIKRWQCRDCWADLREEAGLE